MPQVRNVAHGRLVGQLWTLGYMQALLIIHVLIMYILRIQRKIYVTYKNKKNKKTKNIPVLQYSAAGDFLFLKENWYCI